MQPVPESPAVGSITAAERTYLLDLLRSTQTALHEAVAGLSDAQLSHRPDPNRWSVLDCVEHIVLVEAGVFGRIQAGMDKPAEPDRRAEIQLGDVDVIKMVRSRTVQIVAPDVFEPTGRFGDITATLAAFDATRQNAIDWAENDPDDLRTHFFQHFRLGTLDTYQALLFMASHGERHRKQLEEVRKLVSP